MLKRDGRITTTAAIVRELLSHLELLEKTREQQAALIWDEVVGGPIAAKTEVLDADRGVLFVRARTPAWAQELAMREEEIRGRLNARLGSEVIREVRFTSRGGFRQRAEEEARPGPPVPDRRDVQATPLGEDDRAAIAAAAAQATAPDLAASIQRAATCDAQLARWRLLHGWRPCGRCGELTYGSEECVACRIARRSGQRPAEE
jgi:predicted nucleic acid-binding Zn ribbon protein